ncbi:PLA2G3 [Branchiostoma lanceolatum]|uniref:PLA2G3 protein n=1 Tax=Branchiostoma lanceolatum TaxID=7740 RepID=A0A8K0AEC2_BRALA|nr:PLA2G3 [Branchiostoma lanceolatum]
MWTVLLVVALCGMASAAPQTKFAINYPGTLWCGTGTPNADPYEPQLGNPPTVDRCCLAHYLCPDYIRAWATRYGMTNMRPHTITSCDCGRTMYACLQDEYYDSNDPAVQKAAEEVGYLFSNVIGACFEWEEGPNGEQLAVPAYLPLWSTK